MLQFDLSDLMCDLPIWIPDLIGKMCRALYNFYLVREQSRSGALMPDGTKLENQTAG